MSHNKTRQLARALRLNRSTSFSSSYVPPVSLSFGQHFASTRPISPTSSTSSTYSKDYGYSSSQSYPYSSSTSSSSYLEVRPQKSLHRHSSFNPSDYRPKYFPNESSIYKEPKLTSQYNKDVKLSNSNYSSDTINYDTKLSNNNYTNIQSNTTTYLKDKSSSDYMNIQPKPLLDSRQSSSVLSRRSIFTKCRRSSSLMSRYKPKSLRFADDTPCILSIYVAEPNKTSRLVYPKKEELEEKEVVKGILKTPNEDFYVNDEYEQESDVEDEEEEVLVEKIKKNKNF